MQKLILRPEEKAALELRELYSDYGYSFYRMSRFEEYDFYSDKKDFLTSPAVLTFTDADGRLRALRPDVTLSIIKNFKQGTQRYFYDEKIYRVPRNSGTFREIPQAGIECMGILSTEDIRGVIELALKSLHILGKGRCILDVCHAGQLASHLPADRRSEFLKCIASKNIHGLKELGASRELLELLKTEGTVPAGLEGLQEKGTEIRTDFSAAGNLTYYNGIVFKGYVEGRSECVLSGGQYDSLMELMGHKGVQGIGFAVDLRGWDNA